MQFFDLNRQFNLNDLLIPRQTLAQLAQQEWYLSKVRVEYDCLTEQASDVMQGQVILQSNQNIQIELDWILHDTGQELNLLFLGIDTEVEENSTAQHYIIVKGAEIVDQNQKKLSSHALCLWLDGTLFSLLPHLRQAVKSRLNLWNYVTYAD